MSKLFGQLIRTAVNTTLLPVEVVKDIVTLGNYGDGSHTVAQLKLLKKESKE